MIFKDRWFKQLVDQQIETILALNLLNLSLSNYTIGTTLSTTLKPVIFQFQISYTLPLHPSPLLSSLPFLTLLPSLNTHSFCTSTPSFPAFLSLRSLPCRYPFPRYLKPHILSVQPSFTSFPFRSFTPSCLPFH